MHMLRNEKKRYTFIATLEKMSHNGSFNMENYDYSHPLRTTSTKHRRQNQ